MNRVLARILLSFVALATLTATLSAETEGFFLEPAPRIIGANLRLGYRLPLLDDRLTSVSVMVGGAWGGEAYFRYPDDTMYDPGTDPAPATFNRVNLQWDFGVEQDIAPSGNLEVAPFLYYRGLRNFTLDDDRKEELILASPRSDASGILINSLLAGTYVDAVDKDDVYATKGGFYGEASWDWAPAWFANRTVGSSDYLRLNLTLKGFVPLARVGSEDAPVIGAYMAGFFAADGVMPGAISGDVPHAVRSTFGGLDPRRGLGGAVRGLDSQRFDSTLKLVGNLEARVAFLSLLDPVLVPGLVVYVDGGYFYDTEELSVVEAENSGTVLTTGAGISADFFGIATLVFYTQYYLGGLTVSRGSPWTPLALGFGLHF